MKRLGYVCEMTGGQNPKPTTTPGQSDATRRIRVNNRVITASFWPAPDSHCDAGYLLFGDFCYKFVTESVSSWSDAEAQCQRDQAHLASFHSEEELSFIAGERPRV